MTRWLLGALVMCLVGSTAVAAPKVVVSPTSVTPGQAVLVTVTGVKEEPAGTGAGTKLAFFKSKTGYQAVFAVPLDTKPGDVTVAVKEAKDITLAVKAAKEVSTDVIVEEELANPGPEERKRIDADNAAILGSFKEADEAPMFTGAFKRPPGKVTSPFAEWRTFNDGHKSQHLGLDLGASEGSKVRAANSGKVVLVQDALLAGNVVVIAHGGGIATAYFHLSSVSVTVGAEVAIGDEIGLAGKTGRTTGPHLHISVRVPGGFVDPATFFKLKIAPIRTIKPAR